MLVLLTLLLAPADHDWNQVSYTRAPLVQQGGPNLAPAISTPAWELRDGARVAPIDGLPAAWLPAGGERSASVRISLPAEPETMYRLSWRSRFTAGTRLDLAASYPGLHGWWSPVGPPGGGRGALPAPAPPPRPPGDWRTVEYELLTPAGTTAVSIMLEANLAAGEAQITDLALSRETIPAEAGRELLRAEEALWGEVSHAAEPPMPAEPVIWRRADFDLLFPHSRPHPAERSPRLLFTGTAGEVAVSHLAITTPRPAEIRLESDLPGLNCRAVRYQPRKQDYYGRGFTWRWAADVLLDQPSVVVAGGETAVWWVTLTIPQRAASGRIRVLGLGPKPIEVPVRVDVHPFDLAEAGADFCLYGDTTRWNSMSDEQVAAELTDFKEHGINRLMPPLRAQATVRDGQVIGCVFDQAGERAMRLVSAAGFRPPYFWWAGHLVDQLAASLGVTEQVRGKRADAWPPAMAAATTTALRMLRADAEQRGWWPLVLVAIDEPGYWKKDSLERLEWDRTTAAAAGWEVYCSSSYPPSDPMGRGLRYHCYGGGHVRPENTAALVAETHAAGQLAWSYSTGSYSGQMGRLGPNRFRSGLVAWRSGVDGIASWTFQRPRGNAYDDFLPGQTAQSCITYPAPGQPGISLDTPHWEALRQGWYDYRYARTLALALARRDSAEVRAAYQALLEEITWGGEEAEGSSTAACDLWRARIAALILRLRGADG